MSDPRHLVTMTTLHGLGVTVAGVDVHGGEVVTGPLLTFWRDQYLPDHVVLVPLPVVEYGADHDSVVVPVDVADHDYLLRGWFVPIEVLPHCPAAVYAVTHAAHCVLPPGQSSPEPRQECGRSEEHTSELQSRPHLVCR